MSVLVVTPCDLSVLVERVGLHPLMDSMIERLHRTLAEARPGAFDLRARDGFSHGPPLPGALEWMPVMQNERVATIKVVGYNPANPSLRGLPTVVATLSAFDMETGCLMAQADGVFLTAVRTGAASAVASRVLALPDSQSVGMVGCGTQAVTQLHGLSRLFPLRRVNVYDTDPAVARSFVGRVAFLGLDVRVAPLETVEAEADILVTATSVGAGEGPVIGGTKLRPHVHINAVGSDFPGKLELPLEVLRGSLVVPDFLAQARVEGECQQLAPGEEGPDLMEVVQREAEFREWRARRTVFDSTGFALEDHVALGLLMEWAEELGLGTRVELEMCPEDPRNPYLFSHAQRSGAAAVAAAAALSG